MDDLTLLKEYAERNSEAAFETLVARRIDFVHSAALRQVRDPVVAGEITQAVFIILARKAGQISSQTNLTGWLFRTTRFTALAHFRAAARRRQREQEARMQSEIESTVPDPLWEQLSPLLDDALAQLGEKDRQALLLRFFENKSLGEVGQAQRTREDTARKRVTRALEKLRRILARRGVISTSVLIGGAISANSVQAAPAGLVVTISAAAMKGSAVTVSTLTLVKGALKLMNLVKLKTAALIGAAVILASGTTVVVNKLVAQSQDESSGVPDTAWDQIDSRALNQLAPAFVLRPTHFAAAGGPAGGGMSGGMVSGAHQKMLARTISFDGLMSMAYGVDPINVLSPADKPSGSFDLLMTTPDASMEKLQAEIQRQLGYVAHRESRQTDVLLLEVKQADAPGLRPSQGQHGGGASSGSSSSGGAAGVRKWSINTQNQPISGLVKNLQHYFGRPILDRTGLTGNYDASLAVTMDSSETESDAIAAAMLSQLGLELAPSIEASQMLIVEKVK